MVEALREIEADYAGGRVATPVRMQMIGELQRRFKLSKSDAEKVVGAWNKRKKEAAPEE